jgi:hypothetical protein
LAATSQLAVSTRAASPIALWHLLSLDAPTVAALWTWFIARASHVRLPLASPAAMALAVWILYAADRLLDAARPGTGADLEARHHFHHRHRRTLLAVIPLAAAALALLLRTLDSVAIQLYLIEGAFLLAWFLILHATRSAHRLPKELAVGLFFSCATFIPTVARSPGLRLSLLPAAMLFAAVCSLNCLFIYAWEHDEAWEHGEPATASPNQRRPHSTTRVAVEHLAAITAALIVAGIGLAVLGSPSARPLAAACAAAAAALLAIDRARLRISRIDLRAAADVALLTPLLLLPLLR